MKSSGIGLLQHLAGEVWTDYNEHDPGVTILEQICYALTDVMYRSDFEVADFLADPHGLIAWERQSLLPPELVFPCRPTTAFDYRALLLNQFEELQSLEFEVVPKSPTDPTPTGLYRILLGIRPDAAGSPHDPAEQASEIKSKILHAYAKWRNLGEDLDFDSMEVIPVKDYVLKAHVHIKEDSDPAEILARIYVVCGARLSAGVGFISFDQELNRGKTPEEIFAFPFTERGVPHDQGAPPQDFPPSDVYALIKTEVPGVEDVEVLADDSAVDEHQPDRRLLCLRLPRENEEIPVKIFCNGRERKVSLHEFRMRYVEELNAANRGPSYKLANIPSILPRPQGEFRNLAQYASVQNQFPAGYGVGPRGVPSSAPREKKAQVLQLKAYLLFFDQHLANLLAQMGSLRYLFSTALDKNHTYFHQELSNDSFPGIQEVLDHPARALQRLSGSRQDHDRAKRLVEYMLALYGETFPSDSRRSDDPIQNQKEEDTALDAMIGYLTDIVSVTRDRAAAADYTHAHSRNNRSGLERNLSHLLGFEQEKRAGTHGVRVIEHILLRAGKTLHAKTHADDFFSFRITVLLPDWLDRCKDENFRLFAENLVDSSCPAHLYADIFWINQSRMEVFDELYEKWRVHHVRPVKSLSDAAPAEEPPAAEHHPAAQLVRFLHELDSQESHPA